MSPSDDVTGEFQGVGIRFTAGVPVPGSVDRDTAIAEARKFAGAVANDALADASAGVVFDDQLVMVSERNQSRDYPIQNRPIWLVTFRNVHYFARRPRRDPQAPPLVNHEIHVLVDQRTGKALESYSFR